MTMNDVYVLSGVRTPFGRYGGALSAVRADDLGAVPIRALMNRHPTVDWAAIDDVVFGCANQAGEDNRNVARMAALLAGLPVSVPATTVNRLCGSSLDAIAIAARAIRSGEAGLVIAGGVESMSRAPFVLGKATEAYSRQPHIEDTTIGWRFVNPRMATLYGVDSMPETAENVATEFNISRTDQDLYAWRSQQRAAAAITAGRLHAEIVPVDVPQRKGPSRLVDRDEHPRPDTTIEMLSALKPVVRATGTVTAGNASGVNDGAGALLLGSAAEAARYGLTPRARIVASAVAGVPPRVMGIGPVPAIQKVLAQTGLSLEQMDILELNEAFAAQCLAVIRSFGLPDDADAVNPNGGAIALGHPLGASGARLVITAVNELVRRQGRYALCAMCVGVGQGIAVVLERV
jgi:acetyl-CoA acyltransferase